MKAVQDALESVKDASAVEPGATDVMKAPIIVKRRQTRMSSDSPGFDIIAIGQESSADIRDHSKETAETTSFDLKDCFVPNQQMKRRTSGGRFEVSKVFVMESSSSSSTSSSTSSSHTVPGKISDSPTGNAKPEGNNSGTINTASPGATRGSQDGFHGRNAGEGTPEGRTSLPNGGNEVADPKTKVIALNQDTKWPELTGIFRATPTPRPRKHTASLSSKRRRRRQSARKVAAKSRKRLVYEAKKSAADKSLKRRRDFKGARGATLNASSNRSRTPLPLPRPAVDGFQTPKRKRNPRRRIAFSPESDDEGLSSPYKIRFSSPVTSCAGLYSKTRNVQPGSTFSMDFCRGSNVLNSTVKCMTLQKISQQQAFAPSGIVESAAGIREKSMKDLFVENGGNLDVLQETLMKGFTSSEERMQLQAMMGNWGQAEGAQVQGQSENFQDEVDTLSSKLSMMSIVSEYAAKKVARETSYGKTESWRSESPEWLHFHGSGDAFMSYRGE